MFLLIIPVNIIIAVRKPLEKSVVLMPPPHICNFRDIFRVTKGDRMTLPHLVFLEMCN